MRKLLERGEAAEAVPRPRSRLLLAGAVGSRLRGRRLAKLSGGVYIGLGVSAALSGSRAPS